MTRSYYQYWKLDVRKIRKIQEAYATKNGPLLEGQGQLLQAIQEMQQKQQAELERKRQNLNKNK